jgi:two-component system nitrogen regulation response regulator NtrX
MSRILIVDDEPGIRQSLKGVFEDEGFATDSVSSGEECLKKIADTPYDLVLLDIWLPGIDGIETLRRLRELSPSTRVIMISGHATIATAVTATKLGAYDFIEKPFSLEHTLLIARNALSYRQLEKAHEMLRHQFEQRFNIVGDSIPIKALRKQIALVAPTNSRGLRKRHREGTRCPEPSLHEQTNSGALREVNWRRFPKNHRASSSAYRALHRANESEGEIELADENAVFDEIGDMSLKTRQGPSPSRISRSSLGRQVDSSMFEVLGTTRTSRTRSLRGAFARTCFTGNVIPFSSCPARAPRGHSGAARYFMRLFSSTERSKEFARMLDMLMDYSGRNVREL